MPGTFLAEVAAGPVYRLLGRRDLGTSTMPAMEAPSRPGDLAFRRHTGGHTNGPNWQSFLSFADRYFPANRCSARSSAITRVAAG